MEASELRIGNYIQNIEGEVYRISSIYSKEFYHGSYLYNERHLRQGKKFMKPIPLTEEWLLKFGFRSMDGGIYYEWIKIDFTIWNDTTGFHYYGSTNNKFTDLLYVHQLQNLYFALTGEELTLKK